MTFGVSLLGWLASISLLSQQAQQAHQAQRAKPAAIERGRYLVHQVAMCVQCHSPRDERGQLVKLGLLEGGTIPMEPPFRDRPWAFEAPKLAGLPGWEPQEVVHLLVTGTRRNGRSPRPPMPPFRMTEEDARAIVAYLESLYP
jgi:mono/diheme cytochrome c family protein